MSGTGKFFPSRTMAQYRHLKKAPITEALIDYRVNAEQGVTPEVFDTLCQSLEGSYPDQKQIRKVEGQIQDKDGVMFQQTKGPELFGYMLSNGDHTEVIQFRVDGFTFSRLEPYTSWNQFSDQAYNLWDSYEKTLGPIEVPRIAVRYINRLRIPPTCYDALGRYLTHPPSLIQSGAIIDGYLEKQNIDFGKRNIKANVIRAIPSVEDKEVSEILLDNDVYRMNPIDGEKGEWNSQFDELKDIKNQLFFDSITEEAARLFE